MIKKIQFYIYIITLSLGVIIVNGQVCTSNNTPPSVKSSICTNYNNGQGVYLLGAITSNWPDYVEVYFYGVPILGSENKLPDPGVRPGIYYAVYYDTNRRCYSKFSDKITVKDCCSIRSEVPSVINSIVSDNTRTANLNNAHSGDIPSGSTLVWYTTSDRKQDTKVTNPSLASPGTYYAFYYESAYQCYSRNSSLVTVEEYCPVINLVPSVKGSICIDDITGKADLREAHTGKLPLYSVIRWYTTSDRQTSTWVKDPTSVVPGVYYAFYFDAINSCYSKVSGAVIVKDCCNIHGAIPLVTSSLCVDNMGKANLREAHTGTSPLYSTIDWYTTSVRQSGTKVLNPFSADPGIYYAFYHDVINECYSPSSSAAVTVKSCICVKQPNLTLKGVPSTTGVTTQKYVSGWPGSIPNGFLVLESKDKGMVITRTTSASILTSGLVEGMLIYDTEDKCVKLYDGIVWKCIARKNSCND